MMAIKEQFDQLAKEWYDQAMFHSFYNPIMSPEPCRQLAKLGKQVIPYIIDRLKSGDHWIAWSWLLAEITGVETGSGVVHEDGFAKGDVHDMAEWWIKWWQRSMRTTEEIVAEIRRTIDYCEEWDREHSNPWGNHIDEIMRLEEILDYIEGRSDIIFDIWSKNAKSEN
jgi:hypothetical protein